jgi:hypothetical protein
LRSKGEERGEASSFNKMFLLLDRKLKCFRQLSDDFPLASFEDQNQNHNHANHCQDIERSLHLNERNNFCVEIRKPNMSKEVIKFDKVIEFIRLAPEEAVRLAYQEAAKRLNINTADSDEDAPSGMTNMSDIMSSVMEGTAPSRSNSVMEQLRAKVEDGTGTLDEIAPPDLEVSLKPMAKNDQYGTTDFQVLTETVKTRLQEAKVSCEKIGAHFPFGYGVGKDLLRISKCKVAPGKAINVTVRFYVWSRDGKRGITCYLKK